MVPNQSALHYHDSNGTKACECKALSRRNFLAVASTISSGAIVYGHPFSGWAAADSGRIDIHHHFQPDIYFNFQKAYGKGFDTNQWSLAKDLEDMDQAGTAVAILSLTT